MSAARASPIGQTGNLRVAHVLQSLDVGGLERVVLDLAHEGPELGIASTIVCLEKRGELATEAEQAGAKVVCLGKPPGLRLGTTSRLAAVFRELSPDVVHSHQIGTLFYAGPAARRARVPIVVHTEHGKHYGEGFRRRLLGRLAARNADRFFCVSQDIADAVQRYRVAPAAKLRVIRNGIRTALYSKSESTDDLRHSLGIPPRSPVIGTVGRLSEVKRQDILLDAFALLRKTLPNAHLVLVGDGPLRTTLEARAGRLEIGSTVHFTGYQPEPQRYLHLMDIFAITSRSEGMPLSILEAWAAGVPVVASRVGGLPEMIEDYVTGILVEFGDVPELSRIVCRLLDDTPLRAQIANRARSHVIEQFDVRNMTAAYRLQYLSLLDGYTGYDHRTTDPA